MTHRIIVVGGGGSGVPYAVRLAAQDGVEVLLLEAGPAWSGPRPAELALLADASTVSAATPHGPLAWTYLTRLMPGREHLVARGRVLGGSTAVNGAIFLRAHPDDFADWATTAGDAWSYEAALPALRRLEHDLDHPDDPRHGDRGPIPVARPEPRGRLASAVASAVVGDRGHRWEADKNAGGPPGYGPLPMNARDGVRWDTATAYLEAGPPPQLTLRGDSKVRRVLCERGRAIGVEVDDGHGAGQRILADEVVLSAGAIQTPRLLLRSGIGPAPHRAGDEPWHVDLPGVGRGLSDHPMVVVEWTPAPGAVDPDPETSWLGGLHWSAPGGAARGELELLFTARPHAFLSAGETRPGPLGVLVSLLRPRSRGEVHPEARGGRADADIDYRYLAAAEDREGMRHGVREALRVLAAPSLASLVGEVQAPTETLLTDDAAADAWIAARLGTALHSSGTARMGPATDPYAVTDGRGRVHGIAGLRIADTSILPTVPSRGTAATAVLVGERIAELHGAELRGAELSGGD